MAEYYKSDLAQLKNNNNISVSYQVPELRRDIAPLFDETWITYDEDDECDVLNETVKATLTDILSPYISATSAVTFRDGCHECQNPVHGKRKFDQLEDNFRQQHSVD